MGVNRVATSMSDLHIVYQPSVTTDYMLSVDVHSLSATYIEDIAFVLAYLCLCVGHNTHSTHE